MDISRREFTLTGACFAAVPTAWASGNALMNWREFLVATVHPTPDGSTAVDYSGYGLRMKRDLSAYLQAMQSTDPSLCDRRAQAAYWINLYNAQTIMIILDNYPVRSIRDISISPGFFSRGPWGKKILTVGNANLSLDDIEHQILRPLWRDPRIHYALNCASKGCPNLSITPYDGSNLDAALDLAARNFVNHPRAARIRNGQLIVSSIYHWYSADFGGRTNIIDHLRMYAEPQTLKMLMGRANYDDHDYDWTLNEFT